MARRMTFQLPDDIAGELLRRVPAGDRSRFVAAALSEKLTSRALRLAHACEVANADSDVQRVEEEMEQACNSPDEPWDSEPR